MKAVALLLLRLGAGSLRSFAFVQPPPPAQLEAALASLRALGALDAEEGLTPLGARHVVGCSRKWRTW